MKSLSRAINKVRALRAQKAAKEVPKGLDDAGATQYLEELSHFEVMGKAELQMLCTRNEIPASGTVLDMSVRLARVSDLHWRTQKLFLHFTRQIVS